MATSIEQARREVQRAFNETLAVAESAKRRSFWEFERELGARLLALGRSLVVLFLIRAVHRPRAAEYVVGKGSQESARILHGLRDFATSEPYHYAHEWEVGDAVMWDNTGTMHRAMPYNLDCGRRMHRVTLEGEEPIAAAA